MPYDIAPKPYVTKAERQALERANRPPIRPNVPQARMQPPTRVGGNSAPAADVDLDSADGTSQEYWLPLDPNGRRRAPSPRMRTINEVRGNRGGLHDGGT